MKKNQSGLSFTKRFITCALAAVVVTAGMPSNTVFADEVTATVEETAADTLFGSTATNLEAGTYLVPVEMRKSTDPTALSMASACLAKTGLLTVGEGGSATLQTRWQTMTMQGVSANILTMSVFQTTDYTSAEAIAAKVPGTIVSERTVDGVQKPEVISIQIPDGMKDQDGVYFGITTDLAMMANQTAYLYVDYAKAQRSAISLDKSSVAIAAGQTGKVTAVLPESGFDTAAVYTSSNPEIAAVDAEGNITAAAAGTATITATANGALASCTVTVLAPGVYALDASFIKLAAADLSMTDGAIKSANLAVYEDGSIDLYLNLQPFVTYGVTAYVDIVRYSAGGQWKDAAVQSTDENGHPTQLRFSFDELESITGIAFQKNAVSAAARMSLDFASLTTVETEGTLTVTKSFQAIVTGSTAAITAVVTGNENAIETAASFESSDTSVATVAVDGTVTALKAGTATITIKANGKKQTAAFTVLDAGLYSVEAHIWHATNDAASMSDGILKSAYLLADESGKIAVYLNLQALTVYGQTAWSGGIQYPSEGSYADAAVTEQDSEGHITQTTFVLPENTTMTAIKLVSNGRSNDARLKVNFTTAAAQKNDKSALNTLITKAAAIQNTSGQYSAASFAVLTTAIAAAQAVQANAAAVQTDIDAQVTALNAAVNALDKATISLSKKTATIYTGTASQTSTVNLTASVHGDSSAVTWKSSNSSIAAVSSTGVVTAKAAGTATITATANGVSATCTVTVKAPTLTLATTSATIAVGKTATIAATAAPSGTITYKTSNSSVATVSTKGVVKGIKAGTATITVTCNGVSKTYKVTVKKQTLTLTKTSATVAVGKTVTIAATASPSGTITYKSSSTKVATVTAKGVVKGIKAGTTKITVTCNGVSKTYTVTVKKQTLTLTKTSATVAVGKTVTIKAAASPSGTITYKSSSTKVATVTSKGVVKGIKKGTATIKVTCNGVTKTYKITVK